jgi:hypothetical protein
MSPDTPAPSSNASPPAENNARTQPSSPLPQTPTPARGKRANPFPTTPLPPKKRFLDNFTPEPDTPREHDFWVTVWHNGERTKKTSTVATYATLAVYKSIGYEASCKIQENKGMSKLYEDDNLWFKATLPLPPKAAAELLAITTIESRSAVVVFAPFPCASQTISVADLEELREESTPQPGVTREVRAKPAQRGGRPFTWSLKKVYHLNKCVARNKKEKVENPPKHPLQEHLELSETLEGPIEEDDIA